MSFSLFGAAEQDRERSERVHREEHADAAAGPREFLDHDAQVEDAAAAAAVGFGDPDPHESGFAEGFLDLPGVLLDAVVVRGERADHALGDVVCLLLPSDVGGGQ
jgi:hypothetical protein